jgi:hypothetical protein
MSPWTAASWALTATGHPALAAAAAGYSAAALAGLLSRRGARRWARAPRPADEAVGQWERTPLPVGEAVRLAGIGHLRGGLALARAVRRAWAPAAVLLAVAGRRSRPALAAVAVAPGLVEWFDRRPRLDPARFAALRLADDLAYAAGVWAGCARQRSVRALLPDLAVRRRSR